MLPLALHKVSIPFQKSLRDFRGFTLVELLVVIGIISILATILLLQLGTARAKSRDAKRIADINQVRSAVEAWFDDCGSYPNSNAFGTIPCGTTTGLAPKYLAVVPLDPLTPGCTATYSGAGCYGYAANSAGVATRYQVWSELEVFNRSALGTDTDVNVGVDWSAAAGVGVNGTAANETCADTTLTAPQNCIFDLGLR